MAQKITMVTTLRVKKRLKPTKAEGFAHLFSGDLLRIEYSFSGSHHGGVPGVKTTNVQTDETSVKSALVLKNVLKNFEFEVVEGAEITEVKK